jgi:hypothetical protein
MKSVTLLTIAIFLAEFSFSQTDFRKGYIINNQRDTLFGLVDYRVGVKTHKSCAFKKSEGQSTVTYEPNDIIGYGFNNDKVFLSREIAINDEMPEVVFLEVIVSGPVSLYNFKGTYFLEQDNNGLHELINKQKQIYVNGKMVLQNTNQYIGTINMLVFDCAEIRSRVQKIRLNEKALTNLIEDYNRCKGESSITFKAKKPWTKAIIGIIGGLSISHINFEVNPAYEHLAGDFEVSKSATIGASLDILSPRLNERISFHGELLYLAPKYHNYTLYNRPSSVERNYVTIELKQLKVPIGLRYTLSKRDFTPYFNLGISGTIHVSSNPKWVQEVESNGVVSTTENKALETKDKQFGVWVGLGVLKSINRNLNAFCELRYEQSNGITPYSDLPQALASKIANLQIFIGIRM